MSKDSQKHKDEAKTAEGSEHPPLSDLEREFFDKMMAGGQPIPDDFVDPELEMLQPNEDLAVARPMLLLMVMAFAVFLMSQYTNEFFYAFTSNDAIELGAVEELRFSEEWFDSTYQLPSNRYVALTGIPEAASGSGSRAFYHLLGSTIVVEDVAANAEMAPELENVNAREQTLSNSYHMLHEAPGRLIAFADLGRSYAEVIVWYSNVTKTHYCGYEPSEELRQHFNTLRGQAEAELYDELGRRPNDEEVDERLGGRDRCQEGYLLVANKAPRDYWFFPLIYAVLGLITLVSAYILVRGAGPKGSTKGKKGDKGTSSK